MATMLDEDVSDDEEFTLPKKNRDESEMDMTPMVDVTFLLLIFFMVTAAFSLQKSLEVPTPKEDRPSTTTVQEKPPEEDPDFVTVYVDENNTFHVQTVDWEKEAPTRIELITQLRDARNGDSSGNKPTKMLVKANEESLHDAVVTALDAGRRVGMEQVQLMTVEGE